MKEYGATAALSVIFLRGFSGWQQRIRSFGFRGALSSFQLITAEYPALSTSFLFVAIDRAILLPTNTLIGIIVCQRRHRESLFLEL